MRAETALTRTTPSAGVTLLLAQPIVGVCGTAACSAEHEPCKALRVQASQACATSQQAGNAHPSQLHSAAYPTVDSYSAAGATAGPFGAGSARSVGSASEPSAPQRRHYSTVSPSSAYLPLEEPAQTETVPPDIVPAVLRASHWITAQRGRSFEDRGLRVRVKVRRSMLPVGRTDS